MRPAPEQEGLLPTAFNSRIDASTGMAWAGFEAKHHPTDRIVTPRIAL